MKTNSSSLRRMVYAAMFGALTALGSLIVIPLQPIPISLQSLFAGLAGVLLGAYTGALSQVVYVLLGIIGLPVFAGGKAGTGTLLGPTGGYIIGFIAAAFVIGKIIGVKRESGWAWILMAMVVGNLVIYTLGTLYLAYVADLSLLKALMAGVVPFLPGDILKLVVAAWLALKLRQNFKF